MPTAEAQVKTERPSRYLVQFCRHASQMGQPRRHPLGHRPPTRRWWPAPEVQHVQWSSTHGIVSLSWGQCTLQATPDTLTLRAEAIDEDHLQRLQALVAGRLERFGNRDHLRVNWHRPQAPTLQLCEASAAHLPTGNPATRRAHLRTIVIIAAGALAVAVHLGLGGAMLAASRWAGWAADVVLAVVLVKIIAVSVIGLRQRLATRRGNAAATSDEP